MTRWLNSIYSDGTDTFVIPQFPMLHDAVTIRLRVLKTNRIAKVYLRTCPEGEEVLIPMACTHHDDIFSWYQAETTLVPHELHYRFKIVAKDQVYWYTAAGIFSHTPTDATDFRLIAGLTPPKWLLASVFYQIFPDTFCQGQPKVNPWPDEYQYLGRKPILRPWDQAPGDYEKSQSLDFFGGDLSGIRSQIGYFERLGVNGLYLTPIFQAPSNHRYDVQDYFLIDPLLGTNAEFAELTQALHARGLRVILDGVFNHTGVACRWFNKCGYYREPGAYQSPTTPYSDFYLFPSHPDGYQCWMGVSTLPKLNYQSAQLREMIYRGEQSVMQFWLKSPYNADGWRIDVANMTARNAEYQAHREVFHEMRTAVKTANPEAYFMGENFFDPSDFLRGDGLDAVMNYLGFAMPVRQWLSGLDNRKEVGPLATSEFDRQLAGVRASVSWQIAMMQYNLLNCHDLPRLKAIVDHPAKNRLGAILLLTYLGVPSLFYGDEIGMGSGSDQTVESSRRCMPWQEAQWDQELWQFYHRLIELRRSSLALQQGGFKTLYADGDIYCYARFYRDETVITMLNRGAAEKRCCVDVQIIGLRPGEKLREVLSGQAVAVDQDGMMTVLLPAYTGMVWEGPSK